MPSPELTSPLRQKQCTGQPCPNYFTRRYRLPQWMQRAVGPNSNAASTCDIPQTEASPCKQACSMKKRESSGIGAVRITAFIAVCLGTVVPAHSQNLPQPGLPDSELCEAAAKWAEMEWKLPPGLLIAIGKVESGRRIAGRSVAWPWTINAGGGHFFGAKTLAVSRVLELQASGVRSIDVGCFQVNLLHHSAAFPNLEDAFDPRANATYAARFLHSLHRRTGSWDGAIALYHSATPALGEAYRGRVLSRWTSEGSTVQTSETAASKPVASGWPAAGGWVAGTAGAGVRVWTLQPGAAVSAVPSQRL